MHLPQGFGSQRMGRLLASLLVLTPLALLGACLEMAPTSSVPFQPTAERQARYAAEIALAVKEDRRGEISEAAANGRMVLPELPEIWGPPASDQKARPLPQVLDLAGLAPEAGNRPAERGCALLTPEPPDGVLPGECRSTWRGQGTLVPPPVEASMLPAAARSAPKPIEAASGPRPRPSG
jgi:hypothetical protein